MLFNSYQFIFVFLPVALIGYEIAGWFHRKAVIAWLGFVSLAFYAYWRPALLLVLVSSIGLNYLAGALISRRIPNRVNARVWLTLAIVLDLAVLCWFKYLFPSLNFLSSALGSSRHWTDVVLPLGISFFTFTQISFLVDLYQGIAKQQDLNSYVLFVTFFPHLIAGPILHHKEMMPQFQQDRRYRLNPQDLAVGLSWFIMGLCKKVLLADTFGRGANPIFDADRLSAGDAWMGALFYTLQLYFDFSGYSDMALGLARMFSINFPLNFNSPYKAASIIDFWQRWHMTLSNYIMAYLYTPVQQWARKRRQNAGKGVSRKDVTAPGAFAGMIAFPMMFSMFVAGVWHGAGFQFVVFGSLHGFYLTINHAWRLFRHKRTPGPPSHFFVRTGRHVCSVLLTFVCVLVGFVFFRARSAAFAVKMLAAMFGISSSPALHSSDLLPRAAAIPIGLAICWFLPNTQQILSRFKPSLQESAWRTEAVPRGFLWSPNMGWAVTIGALFFIMLFKIQEPSTFLYFQF